MRRRPEYKCWPPSPRCESVSVGNVAMTTHYKSPLPTTTTPKAECLFVCSGSTGPPCQHHTVCFGGVVMVVMVLVSVCKLSRFKSGSHHLLSDDMGKLWTPLSRLCAHFSNACVGVVLIRVPSHAETKTDYARRIRRMTAASPPGVSPVCSICSTPDQC